ncbi:MAG: PucR family transcriptional regulator [Anaerovoracaceae bacterium]
MKLTIKECLNLSAFTGANVLGGKSKVDNYIKRVSVLEAKDTKKITNFFGIKNQLMLTGFFGIEEDVDAQLEIVKTLVDNECGALAVFFVGENIKKVDEKVIALCDQIGLPLIQMDSNINMWDVIDEIARKLFWRDDEYGNKLINNTVFHLLNFEKYADFQSAIKGAAINNNFQLVLLSSDFNPILTVETRYQTTIDQAIRLGREKKVEKRDSVYTMIDVDGVLTYWGPVVIQGSTYFMFIVDNDDSYSNTEISKLAEIIELSMGMWKYSPIRDKRAELIKALRRGNISLAYSLKDDSGIDEKSIMSVFFGTGFKSANSQLVIDDFCRKHNLTTLQVIDGDETCGMILGDKSEANCVELYKEIKADRDVRVFHVTPVSGLEGASDAFRLINESWSFAEDIFPYKRVFSKYELAMVSSCVNIQLRGGFIRKNYAKLLEPFYVDSSNKEKQLVDTLETFVLDAGMNGIKTAEFMDVHANTIQYRLKKINEILGAEIMGNRVAPGLTIALALNRLDRAHKVKK